MKFTFNSKLFSITLFLILGLILGLSADIYFGVVSLKQLSKEKMTLENKLQKVQQFIQYQPIIQKQYQQNKQFIKGLFQTPNQSMLKTALSTTILTSAEQQGLYIESLQPAVYRPGQQFSSITFKTVAFGTLKQLTDWMIDLASFSLPIFINTFNLSKQPQTALRMDMDLTILLIPEAHTQLLLKKSHRHFQKFNLNIKRDPFVPMREYFSLASDSFHTEFEKIKFIGYVLATSQRWVLILLPNQKIMIAKPGDFLGKEHAKVISINEKGIWISLYGRIKRYQFWFEEKYAI